LIQSCALHFTGCKRAFARNKSQQRGTPKGEAMGILRTLIFVGGAIALMPSPPPGQPGSEALTHSNAGGGAFMYMAAAAETVSDLGTFCQRKPLVCTTAGAIANTVEAKAKYTTKLIYEWANEATTDGSKVKLPVDLAKADLIETGSVNASAAEFESQNTLTLADIVPEWRGPKAARKG
jgi:Family of unknown function (DUF5330)